MSGGEWIAWEGGECPVAPETIVELRYRAPEDRAKGFRMPSAPACLIAWFHDGEDDDVVAYRVIQP